MASLILSCVDCQGRGLCTDELDPPLCSSCGAGWMVSTSLLPSRYARRLICCRQGPGCTIPCVNGSQFPMDSGICRCNPSACFDGPSCTRECSGQGTCEAGTCVCDEAWWGDRCDEKGCPGIGESCSGHGSCIEEEQLCLCNPGWQGGKARPGTNHLVLTNSMLGPGCNIPDCPGTPDCNGTGICDGSVDPPQCRSCPKGSMGGACELPCVNGNQVLLTASGTVTDLQTYFYVCT